MATMSGWRYAIGLLLICPIGAFAQAPHAIGSPWYDAASKKIDECTHRFDPGSKGLAKAAASKSVLDSYERRFAVFLSQCAPGSKEFFAINRAYQDARLAKVVYRTTPAVLYRMMAANSIATSEKIGSRLVEIHGIVQSVGTAEDGRPQVMLRDGQPLPMNAVLFAADTNEAATFMPGERIIVSCGQVAYVAGRLSAGQCEVQQAGG